MTVSKINGPRYVESHSDIMEMYYDGLYIKGPREQIKHIIALITEDLFRQERKSAGPYHDQLYKAK